MSIRLLPSLLALSLYLVPTACTQEVSHQKLNPNILLIVTDDMGYGDVAISGNTVIKTPNLDQLAEQSVQFSHFYVSPVCAPTRASLLTGRYHQRTGVRSVTNGFETMDPDEITLAEILKEQGYRTGIFGKWHLGEYYPSVPNAQGFDEYLGFRTGHTNYYYDANIERNGRAYQTKGHITNVLTENALKFMDQQNQTPFFCYLAYNAPHTPLQVDSSWWEDYTAKGLAEREARIYGMIEQLDQGIGKILSSLEKQNRLSQTIVIFMSDNGPINGWRVPQEQMRYNAGLRDQKFTVYEGGIRTQCYWRWDGHWNPGTTGQIAAHIDVVPTLMDVLGLSTPNPVDGVSLKPQLETKDNVIPHRMFFQKYSLETLRNPAPFPGGIARRGPWKMVNGNELYNLDQDVGETNNLAGQHPEVLKALKSAYLEWYQDIADDHGLRPTTLTIGHKQENPVHLQPHHAEASGAVEFWGNRGLTGERRGTHPRGVDSDWSGNWKSPEDQLTWKVSFVNPGEYQFSVVARDSAARGPIRLSVSVGGQSENKQIASSDLGKDWNYFELGKLSITSNQSTEISLSLSEPIENNRLEIKELVIESL